MIAIITVMVICLTVIIKTILTIRKDNRRIEELEQTLEDYYKRREQKLMKHKKD
jgi:predicted Holliday junction resolvase-like endonuclease